MHRTGLPVLTALLLSAACTGPGESATFTQSTAAIVPTDYTGLWVGALTINHVYQRVLLQLDVGPSGDVVGYIDGGTSGRTVTSGLVGSNSVNLSFEVKDLSTTHTFTIDSTGSLGTVQFSAVVTESGSAVTQNVTFDKMKASLTEQRYVAVDLTGGQPSHMAELALVNLQASSFLGGYTGQDDCGLVSCSGAITAATVTSSSMYIEVSGYDACAVNAAFDVKPSPNFMNWGVTAWVGQLKRTDCVGTTSVPVALVDGSRTTGLDVSRVLASYHQIARDLTNHNVFQPSVPTTYPIISSRYLDFGRTFFDLTTNFQAQEDQRPALAVTFSRFRAMNTIYDSNVPSFLYSPPSVDFHDRRVAGTQVLFDSETDKGHHPLRFLQFENNRCVVIGNQNQGLTLPYQTAGLRPLQQAFWPFGIHGGGHKEGHPGIDIEFAPGANLLAAMDATVSQIQFDPHLQDSRTVILKSGALQAIYAEVQASTLNVVLNQTVHAGDIIGHPTRICCDPVACGGGNCCAQFDDEGVCDPMQTPQYQIHFGLTESPAANDNYCPPDAFNASSAQSFRNSFQYAFYDDQLTEPFICNGIGRTTSALNPPVVTTWVRATNKYPAQNPEQFIVTRTNGAAQLYTFQFKNGANVTLAGNLTHGNLVNYAALNNNMGLTFNPDGTGVVPAGPITVSLYFTPSAGQPFGGSYRVNTAANSTATLVLDTALVPAQPHGADDYVPVLTY